MPILTPNNLMFGRPNPIPEEDMESIDDANLRKRARYLQKCKNALWSRWSSEYLKGLRERHNLKYQGKENIAKPGDIVVIKGEKRNRAKCKIGVVDKKFKGRDDIVRAVRLRAGKSFLDRPIQHLYPLELSCDRASLKKTLNVNVPEFAPKRNAAKVANESIRIIADEEAQEH